MRRALAVLGLLPVLACGQRTSFFGTNTTHRVGWSNGYLFRATLTVDHTKVGSSDAALFPVLLSGTFAYLADTAHSGKIRNTVSCSCSANISVPADLVALTSSLGSGAALPIEWESYNSSTGALLAWIRVPSISHSTDTVIYLYYDSAATTTLQYTPSAVWSNSYVGVWHLPDGTTLAAKDSTSGANDGTILNAPTAATGQVDGAAAFVSASSQSINVGHGSSLNTGTVFTITAWTKPSNLGQRNGVFSTRGVSNPAGSWALEIGNVVSSTATVQLSGSSTVLARSASNGVTVNTWQYVAATKNGVGNTALLYTNGVALTIASSNAFTPVDNAVDKEIGNDGGDYFAGSIDEVRLSSVVRSADWLLAEYNSMASPGTFVVASSSNAQPATYYVATTGSDSNACLTAGTACLTFSHAESIAKDGDTVRVAAGTYTENLTFVKALAWSANGAVTLQGSSAPLTFSGASSASWTGLTFAANSLGNTFLVSTSATGAATWTRCTFTGTPTAGVIDIQGSGTYTATSPTITLSSNTGFVLNASTSGKSGSITMTGGTITGTYTSGAAVVNVSAGSYAVDIESNSIVMTSATGHNPMVLVIDQPTPAVKSNTLDTLGTDSGSLHTMGVWVKSTGATVGAAQVVGNTILLRATSAYPHYGILVGTDGTGGSGDKKINGAVITDNVIRGARYYVGNVSGLSITTHGIIVGFQLDSQILRNDVAGTGYGIIAKGGGGAGYIWTTGLVAYNVLWNQNTFAGSVQGIYAKGMSGVRFYNNTVWLGFSESNSATNTAQPMEATANPETGVAIDANDFSNNIIAGYDIGFAFVYDDTGGANEVYDYNLYYASHSFGTYSPGGGFAYNGSSLANLAAWQATLTGRDAHSTYGNDPLFVDAANGDFRLSGGSPAIGAGVFIAGVSSANPPNIGAK